MKDNGEEKDDLELWKLPKTIERHTLKARYALSKPKMNFWKTKTSKDFFCQNKEFKEAFSKTKTSKMNWMFSWCFQPKSTKITRFRPFRRDRKHRITSSTIYITYETSLLLLRALFHLWCFWFWFYLSFRSIFARFFLIGYFNSAILNFWYLFSFVLSFIG